LGESLLLSAIAAIMGYFLASWTANLVPILLDIPNLPQGISTEPDSRYHFFAIGLAIVIGLSIWAASAMRATKRSLLPSLVENAGAGGAPRATHWRRGMVILQISFSLILLCASALLCRSLINLLSVNPGFSVDNLYSFSIDCGELEYKSTRTEALFKHITDQLRTTTGVRRVAITDTVPLQGGANLRHVNDRPIPMDDQGTRAIIMAIGPDYFKTMGIPLTAGREFTYEDKASGGRIAVINESLAHILYGIANPIGQRIWVGGDSADREIVGLIKDMKGISLRLKESPSIYMPASFGSISFVLRSAGPAISLASVSTAVKKVDPSLQVVDFTSVADRVSESLYRDRAFALLSICFAGLALILCAIGVFGLTSYSIAGRTKEIGVRIALGAKPGSIYRLVMWEVIQLAFLGCSIGLVVFVAIKRILTSLLFQLTPTDPISLSWAILVLGLTTLLAGFIPSRRAVKLDPTTALRWE
jgi:predicted permease